MYASTTNGTISHTQHYAWSNNSGWVNWDAIGSNIAVTDTAITGYLWSANNGWINLSPTNGGVLNDGEGNLSGFAWDSGAGWIDFTGVHIGTNGVFTGQTASNANFGSMTFVCTNCAVVTDWRPVSVRTPAPVVPAGGGGGGGGGNGPIAGLLPGGASVILGLPAAGSACVYSTTQENHDITGDSTVDIFDFNALMVAWDTPGVQPADITHDCAVDIFDFNALMVGWSV